MKYESLHDRLRGPIATALKKELGVKNTHALPRIQKVVVNVGINRSKMESKEMHEYIGESLARITGQKPVFTRSRKAISNFKIRQGLVVGAVVTLRGRRMEEFLDRLLSYCLPRIRDFRGVTTKLDGHGNYAIGLRDHTIFPEVPPVDANRLFGMQIQMTIAAKNDEEARALLKNMGVPFRPSPKSGKKQQSVDHSAASGDTPSS
ncbi:MAG: 50S ribosomal protein L5 [Candidatus Peribacteraceae bacterium]|nr:50S ribosomal protein L5 [Candidatus Peribacteraceae bacterium]